MYHTGLVINCFVHCDISVIHIMYDACLVINRLLHEFFLHLQLMKLSDKITHSHPRFCHIHSLTEGNHVTLCTESADVTEVVSRRLLCGVCPRDLQQTSLPLPTEQMTGHGDVTDVWSGREVVGNRGQVNAVS